MAEQRHLLIVDDEPVILQILESVFEDEPYRISTAGTGEAAAAIIENEQVHLLITDKNLPDISGLDLLRALKKKDPLGEVIIVTGYASLETALTALELDAFDYILKPLNNVFDIKKKVKQALEKQTITRENQRLVGDLQHQNTALEAALDEAKALQSELIQSEKLAGIGTLAAGIAHEISSPLFGIMGLGEAILDEQDPKLINDYARDIVEYCQNIRDIVVELSSYSRAADNEYLTTVELARTIEDALRLVQRSSPVDRVTFDVSLAEGLYAHARTNEMQQVFVNLIRNAAEAVMERHETGGRVTIGLGKGDNHIWATVEDNGIGIAQDKIPEVFDPFYTTKAPGKGTGLGLNVVYRILTKYRAQISVESEQGQGSCFHVRLPLPS